MTNDTPFFSIVTAVYNGTRYLPALIDSVQAQTFTNYEHIIIDDGSTDDGATVALIESYAEHDAHIRWWTRPNQGAYPTQQEGIAAARGVYVLVINSDDRLVAPESLAQAAAYLHANPGVDMLYGRTRRINEENAFLPDLDPHWRPSPWLIRQLCYIQHCSMLVAKRLIAEHDLALDLDYKYAADWDWINRIFRAAGRIERFGPPIGAYRLHHQQRSREALDVFHAEARAVALKYGGSPRLHFLIRQLLIYRALVVLAWHTLRTHGPVALLRRVVDWLKRRLGR